MTQETSLTKAVAELGETDRLLIEASTLPNKLKERIAQKLVNITIGITITIGISLSLLIGLLVLTLVQLHQTMDSYSAEMVRSDWVGLAFISSVSDAR